MRGSAKGPGDGRAERPQPRHLPAGPQGTLRWLPSPRPPGRGATALQTGLESHSGRTAPSKRGLGPVGGTRGSRHVLLGGTLTRGLRPRPPGAPTPGPTQQHRLRAPRPGRRLPPRSRAPAAHSHLPQSQHRRRCAVLPRKLRGDPQRHSGSQGPLCSSPTSRLAWWWWTRSEELWQDDQLGPGLSSTGDWAAWRGAPEDLGCG